MKRDIVLCAALWVALTVVGETLAVRYEFQPPALSDRAEHIREAFHVLTLLGIPVFTLVVAALAYSVLRFRGEADGDGPPLLGRGPVPLVWLAITSALAVIVMIYPGLTGIPKVVRGGEADLMVQVQGVQWTWLVNYPDYGLSNLQELVLPVGRDVHIEVTSLDVVHSFWVPAFMTKVDAIPGTTNHVHLRPTATASYETEPLMRLQCAELCGLSHARMQIPVRVVTEEEFQRWVAERRQRAVVSPTPAPTPAPGTSTLSLVARNSRFDKAELEAAAGQPLTIELENQDAGVPHNVSLYRDKDFRGVLFRGELFPGPATKTYRVGPLQKGTYYFRCDVHPDMKGTLSIR
jgi:cytochrome c oxidase subunit 2